MITKSHSCHAFVQQRPKIKTRTVFKLTTIWRQSETTYYALQFRAIINIYLQLPAPFPSGWTIPTKSRIFLFYWREKFMSRTIVMPCLFVWFLSIRYYRFLKEHGPLDGLPSTQGRESVNISCRSGSVILCYLSVSGWPINSGSNRILHHINVQ